MSKLISALIAAGLVLGLNASIAQNVESDKDQAQGQEQVMRDQEQSSTQSQGQAGNALSYYSTAGERQVGLELYLMEQQQCSGMAAQARQDCMHLAKVRYEGWAIMQCQLVAGTNQQRCYQNIQAAVSSNRDAGGTASPDKNAGPETGQTVPRDGDRDKPSR